MTALAILYPAVAAVSFAALLGRVELVSGDPRWMLGVAESVVLALLWPLRLGLWLIGWAAR